MQSLSERPGQRIVFCSQVWKGCPYRQPIRSGREDNRRKTRGSQIEHGTTEHALVRSTGPVFRPPRPEQFHPPRSKHRERRDRIAAPRVDAQAKPAPDGPLLSRGPPSARQLLPIMHPHSILARSPAATSCCLCIPLLIVGGARGGTWFCTVF